MSRYELMKKIDAMVSEMESRRDYGSIEIQVQDGRPTLLKQTKHEKLNGSRENPGVETRKGKY